MHLYDATGKPRHYVPYAKKRGTRASTKRDARKHGWYPSFSAIKEVIHNGPLERWKINRHIDACCETSRFAGEDLDTYKARVRKAAMQPSKDATDFGSIMHNHLEQWNRDQAYQITDCPFASITIPALEQWKRWVDQNVETIIEAEDTITVPYVGLGGTLDGMVRLKTKEPCVVDFKTQAVKSEPAFYDNFGWQLATYAMMKKIKLSLATMPRIISFVIDSNGVFPLTEKIYTHEEQRKCWRVADLARLLYFETEDWYPDGVCRDLIPY